MSGDRIQIDDTRLQANLQAYLRTPAAEKVYEEFEVSFALCAVGCILLLIVGFCMLPTIIWTIAGLQALWSVVTLEPFSALRSNPRQHPERLRALIGYGIIIGPDGRHGLALGSFQPSMDCSPDWLASQAALFGKLYAAPNPPDQWRALWDLLHDDMYRPARRRRVPEPYAQGKEMYLLDVEVDLEQGVMSPHETVLFAFVAEPGEKGDIMQLPWAVADAAVMVR